MVKSIQLKLFSSLFFVSLIYTGCSDAAITGQSDRADPTKRDTSSSVKVAEEREAYNEEEEIKNLIREMSQLCENPVTKDTVFVIGNDSILLSFNHSCTGDSFPIPAKYLQPYKLDRFIGHSLKSDIIVERNGVRILDRRIEKKDFGSLIDGSLKEYAVLLYPHLGITGDTIYIRYSISIPLTDVGIGVRADILKDGSIHFGLN